MSTYLDPIGKGEIPSKDNKPLDPSEVPTLLQKVVKDLEPEDFKRLQKHFCSSKKLSEEILQEAIEKLTREADLILKTGDKSSEKNAIKLLRAARLAVFKLHGKHSQESRNILSKLADTSMQIRIFEVAAVHYEELLCSTQNMWRGKAQAVYTLQHSSNAHMMCATKTVLNEDRATKDKEAVEILEKKLIHIRKAGNLCKESLENLEIIIRTPRKKRTRKSRMLLENNYLNVITSAYTILTFSSKALNGALEKHNSKVAKSSFPKARKAIAEAYKQLASCLTAYEIPKKVSPQNFRAAIRYGESAYKNTELIQATIPFYKLAFEHYKALQKKGAADSAIKYDAITVLQNLSGHWRIIEPIEKELISPEERLKITTAWAELHSKFYPEQIEQRVKAYLLIFDLSLKCSVRKSAFLAARNLDEISENHGDTLSDPEAFQIKICQAIVKASDRSLSSRYLDATELLDEALKIADKSFDISYKKIVTAQLKRAYYLIQHAEHVVGSNEEEIRSAYDSAIRAISNVLDSKSITAKGVVKAEALSYKGLAKLSEARKCIANWQDQIFSDEIEVRKNFSSYRKTITKHLEESLTSLSKVEEVSKALDNSLNNSLVLNRARVWRLQALVEKEITTKKLGAYAVPDEDISTTLDTESFVKMTPKEKRLHEAGTEIIKDQAYKDKILNEGSGYRPKETLDLLDKILTKIPACKSQGYSNLKLRLEALESSMRLREHFNLSIKKTSKLIDQTREILKQIRKNGEDY